MNARIIGIIILVLVVAGSLAFYFISEEGGLGGISFERIEVSGYIGSEKSNFLDNPEIQDLLKNKYGIIVDYNKAGSIEMVNRNLSGDEDFLWPSSQVALEIYKINNPGSVKSEIVFNSPIVLYSWDLVTTALESANYITKEQDTYFISDFEGLLNAVIANTSWAELGVSQLYGSMTIIPTDPTKSNSGNMFSGLLANILSGSVVDPTSLDAILPTITEFFSKLGFMEHSTGILFEQYLSKGVGSYPLIVGYENQIVEFSLQNPEIWPRIKDNMRILYPLPTVWSSHPIIALTDNGEKLLEALQDEEIQALAWEQHGFRTGLIGIENDPSALAISGIPQEITSVIPMPVPEVMNSIIQALENK
jgi:hypothetical protein